MIQTSVATAAALHSRLAAKWRRHRATFDELDSGPHDIETTGPRYEVILHVGSRHEPWIEDVS